MNGLGELAGLLALEKVAVALAMHLKVSAGVQTDQLKGLCEFVGEITGVPVCRSTGVGGESSID
ncbi:hypothetical protein [Leptothoe sp. PORK10 BA2]|uniref:hypothetical protein n=1 Tax=Leptothoe sp. PORK10 BA2 TaxID=3110254 RepID=UPI002B2070E3|nr:hypothetical protein [Leptothoe sp. PORK10 BA2]MEA5464674.1 hypothetical protein [Leptothoe sp. PORK10 BA2]